VVQVEFIDVVFNLAAAAICVMENASFGTPQPMGW
jgi:hypothetical protein